MCTITNTKRFKIAWKPIICYKVVIQCPLGTLITPYTEDEIHFGELVKTPVFQTGRKLTKTYNGYKSYIYTWGVIHSCITLIRALNMTYLENAKIIKCVIPRFTRYQVSSIDDVIISKRLKYGNHFE